ncbi:MAG TPA: alpha/beta fold hydrolase [Falsiroseomonas sp.]|jgi:alpha-beta hydrolase superfamily lysophospholipase|nr:alpha/beta fold hydrolase [Falsiroseomonas sp.]
MIRPLLLAAMLAVGTACTPVVLPAGPPMATPGLRDGAILAADGAILPLRRFPPAGTPRAVLLALHGFNDHSGNFLTDSIEALNEAGLLVYAYDQRGFGRAPNRGYWPGAATLASDAADATRLLRRRHPGLPFYLLGESMGASVAILASAGAEPPPVDGYVLLTPAIWSRDAMNALMRGGLWLVARTIPVVPFQGGVGGVVASDNPAALRRLGRDPLVIRHTRVDAAVGLVDLMDAAVAALPLCCRNATGQPVPTLMLLGARDTVVPSYASRAALRRLPAEARLRLGVYAEGFHLLLAGRNRAEVVRDVLGFLAEPAEPLPSGADADAPAWLAGRPLSPAS